jgi:phage-related holin
MSTWTLETITTAKYLWYFSIMSLFWYLDIPQTQILILWVLMILDFFTWVWKQFRFDKKEITSHRAWLWAVKKVWSFTLILSIALVIKALELEADWYIKSVISIFIVSEFYSITQNIYAIRTWIILPEFDVISIFIKSIWEIIKKKIDITSIEKYSVDDRQVKFFKKK